MYEGPRAIGPSETIPANLSVVKKYFNATPLQPVQLADGFSATVNQYCPVMQKMKLNATTAVEHTVQFEGKTVGFCCDDCRDAWASMSDDERRALLTTVLNKK